MNVKYGWGLTDIQTNKQRNTHRHRYRLRHVNAMTPPGLGAGPSETKEH